MHYDIRFKPAFASLFLTLDPGEAIVAEVGAMTSMDTGLAMTTTFDWQGILRAIFGGESAFLNKFTNNGLTSQTIVITPSHVGDMICVDIDDLGLCLQPRVFVACTTGVNLGLEWAGWGSFFGGEGLFRLKLTGKGKAFIGCFGGISEERIPGTFVVDTGHLVAYEPTTKIRIKFAGSFIGSIKSGEGLVMELLGNGKVYLQSRSVDGLVRFLSPKCR